MPILTLPTTPACSASTFGLLSNTQQFENPLTGQTQTLERPGARWQASYTLPPMKRAQAASWQSFLTQLRGGAGRFYAYDPDARTPRGTGLANATTSRNEIRNGNCLGATNGTFGSGGIQPSNWLYGGANGLVRQIVGSGVKSGISYVELRWSGTPTGNAMIGFESNTQIACSEGEVWTGSFYYRLTAGSLTNIVNVSHYFTQMQADGTLIGNYTSAVGTVDATWRRSVHTRTLTDTTPDTSRVRNGFYLTLTAGQAIDITVRVGNVQLERASSASVYIATTGTARSRDSGARVEGAQTAGNTLKSWNWQANSAVLKAGDYVAFDTASGRALHLVTTDVSSDTDGRATLTLEPPLRTPPGDNAALILQSASCIMALDDASVNWQTDAQGIYRLSFAGTERF